MMDAQRYEMFPLMRCTNDGSRSGHPCPSRVQEKMDGIPGAFPAFPSMENNVCLFCADIDPRSGNLRQAYGTWKKIPYEEAVKQAVPAETPEEEEE